MKKPTLKGLKNLFKQTSPNKDDTKSMESFILGLDDSLFKDDEDPFIQKLDSKDAITAVVESNDHIDSELEHPFMYNELLEPSIAKTILGEDFDPFGTNYRMYTDAGTTAITYDNISGEEVVIRLDAEPTKGYTAVMRDSIISPDKPKHSIIQIVLTITMFCIALATVTIIILLKVG